MATGEEVMLCVHLNTGGRVGSFQTLRGLGGLSVRFPYRRGANIDKVTRHAQVVPSAQRGSVGCPKVVR